MADYYPLIAKAVAGLEKNTGEARRILYERARNALVTQLRGVTPALGESEITRERLALEEAIRKVEADAARKARSDSMPGRAERAERTERERAERAERTAERAERTALGSPASSSAVDRAGADKPAEKPADKSADKSPDRPGDRPGGLGAAPSAPDRPVGAGIEGRNEGREAGREGRNEGREARRPLGPSLTDRGLKGFRDVVAEAESLGEATAQASKTAREAFAATAPSRDGTRIEPHVEPEGLRPSGKRGSPAPLTRENPPFSRDIPKRSPPASEAPPRSPGGSDSGRGDSADLDFSTKSGVRPYLDDHDYRETSGRPFPLQPEALPRGEEDLGSPLRMPIGGKLIKGAVALVAVLAVVGLGWFAWPTLSGLFGPSKSVVTAPAQTPSGEPGRGGKITDRVGSQQPGAGARPQQDAPAVAQRVVLYEEDPADPGGKRSVGTAVWRTETIVAAPGQAPDMVVRADIEIPERNTSVRWSLRRNSDRSLPASHTIEIMFTLPPDFPNGGISNIPGILMKQAEQTRGVPLAGLAVKVTTGFFLIGLSSTDTDMQRNIQLLKERAWFDVPVVFGNGRRAIMAIEKGTPGERAFAEAFAAWGE
ncbi:MAG: hypothetical protein HXX10_03345 [Rhodoplanes sp.]|uniref:hypothetical protein n=1 Tax=Rhodoplanes sp. TaxID=1968906 RepID=UPI001792FACC|nr:hypothetical protein [Rhodoplanes sp.]NVO13051.1 hypothetical protein [Rhodoplanes sp.]